MLSRPLCLAVLLAIFLAVHAAAARAASSSVWLAAKGEAKLLAGDVGGAARTLLKASVKAPYNATLAALALQCQRRAVGLGDKKLAKLREKIRRAHMEGRTHEHLSYTDRPEITELFLASAIAHPTDPMHAMNVGVHLLNHKDTTHGERLLAGPVSWLKEALRRCDTPTKEGASSSGCADRALIQDNLLVALHLHARKVHARDALAEFDDDGGAGTGVDPWVSRRESLATFRTLLFEAKYFPLRIHKILRVSVSACLRVCACVCVRQSVTACVCVSL
jgi:hypothetical protein